MMGRIVSCARLQNIDISPVHVQVADQANGRNVSHTFSMYSICTYINCDDAVGRTSAYAWLLSAP